MASSPPAAAASWSNWSIDIAANFPFPHTKINQQQLTIPEFTIQNIKIYIHNTKFKFQSTIRIVGCLRKVNLCAHSYINPEFIIINCLHHPPHPPHHPPAHHHPLDHHPPHHHHDQRRWIKGRVDCAGASATNADGSVLLLLPSLIHLYTNSSTLIHLYTNLPTPIHLYTCTLRAFTFIH